MADNTPTPHVANIMGGTLNALPIDRMVSAPILAAFAAQLQASEAYADWIKTTGLDEAGNAIMVEFKYEDQQLDAQGVPTGTVLERKIQVPLLALLTHPTVNIENVDVDFEVTISSSEQTTRETEAGGGFKGKVGWGPFSVSFHGSVSHKAAQTRSSDTRARYAFKVTAQRQDMSEGMHRVLEALLTAATRPQALPPPDSGPRPSAPARPAAPSTNP